MQIDILSEAEVALLRQLIDGAENIIICCHKSPDGDALGSSLGWAEYLRQIGKEPRVIVPDSFPDFLRWLPHVEKIVRYDKHPEEVKGYFEQADLVFCLDFNAYSRVDDMQTTLENCQAPKVMIDHHLAPSMDTALMVSHPDISSTSELIFRIVSQLGGFDEYSRLGASCIYCGMMTDTGGFTYNSNYPEIYYIIGQLLTKRINKDKIYRNVYNNYSSWAIRFRGYIMSQKLNVFNDCNASYFAMSREDMKDFHFVKGDAEGLVNEPLRIKGQKLVIALREDSEKDNLVLVSLRSVDDFPCNEMAARFFNGGGHLNASGGKLHCSLEEAENVVKEAVKAYADRLRS